MLLFVSCPAAGAILVPPAPPRAAPPIALDSTGRSDSVTQLSESVAIRVAEASELAAASSPLFEPLAALLSVTMFEPASEAARATLARETEADLVRAFAGESRRAPSAVGRSALLLAEDGDRLVGVCGLQALSLTPDGRGERLLSSMRREERRSMAVRPLLSNLAVLPDFRRKRIGSRLVARAEALATEWGFDELLLLVGEENRPARALYAELGYAAEGVCDGEECCADPWWWPGRGVSWAPCRNVCMRRTGLADEQ